MLQFTRTNREPARRLADIDIPESAYKPDFDIGARYTAFAAEIVRLSLVGIAVFGFLLSEVVMKSSDTLLKACAVLRSNHAYLLYAGIFLLVFALALSLVHRFLSTSCLYYQIMITRSLKRLDNDHWTKEEKDLEQGYLTSARNKQFYYSNLSHGILMLSALCLFSGFALVGYLYYRILVATFI